jgi:hypothetical protein
MFNPKSEILTCRHTNISHVNENSLLTYSLLHTVNFAARTQNNSSTAIDNIFVGSTRLNLSSKSPIMAC